MTTISLLNSGRAEQSGVSSGVSSAPSLLQPDSQPVIGQAYLVPSIVTRLEANGLLCRMPVLGHAHHDRDYIKSRGRHIHFDVRFISDTQLRSIGISAQQMMCKIKTVGSHLPEVIQQEFICAREMPDFPSYLAPWADALAIGYKGKQVGADLLCPHQGICLGNLPQDADGNVTCPGHGLRWNLRTGKSAGLSPNVTHNMGQPSKASILASAEPLLSTAESKP